MMFPCVWWGEFPDYQTVNHQWHNFPKHSGSHVLMVFACLEMKRALPMPTGAKTG